MDAIAAVKCRRVRLGQGSAGFVTGSGRVELDGHDPDGLPPHERAHRGLARTWQGTELFHDLDVRENLMVAVGRPGRRPGPKRPAAAAADAEEALGIFDMARTVMDVLFER